MYVNWRQVNSEALTINTGSGKTCTMAYETHFSCLGILYGNTGLHIVSTQFMKGSLILIFDLSPDGCASVVTPVSPTTGASAFNSNSKRL